MPTKTKKGKKTETDSKKSVQRKKEKIIEDKTFGLKNKKKSKVVQNAIKSIEKNVMNSGDPRQRKLEEQRRQVKAAAKARKQAEKEERDALFGEALLAVSKKTSTKTKGGMIEAKGRDHDDEEKKNAGTSKAMKMMYQMDAKEAEERLSQDPNYVRTIEDEIEMQRQKLIDQLRESGKKGTPVTEESFRKWQEEKRKRKAEAAKKLVEAELRKKKGGKGLSVLSGRELYDYNENLFQDQEDDQNGDVDKENGKVNGGKDVNQIAEKVQSDLFLEGDDDDLDDIEDD